MKVVVIGAGASGIIASLVASKENEVTLLERNDKIGKKILLTGNGRCNYWNSDISIEKYNTDSRDNLAKILECKEKVLTYLEDLGIYPKIKNGYYYPNSNQASSIEEIFSKELEKNVNIVYNCKVEDIVKENGHFIIKSNLNDITCDKVIIACGSKSCPKPGSDGNMFNIIDKIHTVNTVLPSLVPLEMHESFLKDWNNLRVDAKLSLFVNGNLAKEEIGEVQLTDYGISGISTFNISGIASRALNQNKNVEVRMNFLPNENINMFMDNRSRKLKEYTIEELLESVLPYQLIHILLKVSGIKKEDIWDKLSNDKKQTLLKNVSDLKLEVTGTLGFDRSQVSTGGVSLKEINPSTLESLKEKGMYLIGEVLDVDGICGGFTLAFAFMTGYLAGIGVNND